MNVQNFRHISILWTQQQIVEIFIFNKLNQFFCQKKNKFGVD